MKKDEVKDRVTVDVVSNTSSDVSKTFERKNYTNTTEMNKYKESHFNSKKTAKDEYTGEELHIKNKPAANKYKSNKTSHQAQTDHTVSEKEAYDFGKKLPNLNDSDVKRIINNKKNFKIVSRHFNASKQDTFHLMQALKSDLPLKAKVKMINAGVGAEAYVRGSMIAQSTINTVKKDLNDIATGSSEIATNAASINLARWMSGDATFGEAAIGTIKDTAKGEAMSLAIRETGILNNSVNAFQGGIQELEKQLVKKVGKDISSSIIGKTVCQGLEFVSKNVSKVVTVALYTGKTVLKWANGEITTEEAVCELGETGCGMATMAVGQAIGAEIGSTIGVVVGLYVPVVGVVLGYAIGDVLGRVIGGAIGYLAGSKMCQYIKSKMDVTKNIEQYNRYRDAYLDYAKQVEQSRIELEEYLDYIHKEQQEKIRSGFEKMKESLLNEDAQGTVDALDYICSQFSVELEFKSLDDFKNKMKDKSFVFKLGNET